MDLCEVLKSLKENYPKGIVAQETFFGIATVEVTHEEFFSILSSLKNVAFFDLLVDMSGVDYLDPRCGTLVFCHLRSSITWDQIRITVFVSREEKLQSIVSLWEGAEWFERELFDMFGVVFEGHKELKRILMPDDWVGHPLRKDYPLRDERVQFKGPMVPKEPSRIIEVERNQQAFP